MRLKSYTLTVTKLTAQPLSFFGELELCYLSFFLFSFALLFGGGWKIADIVDAFILLKHRKRSGFIVMKRLRVTQKCF